MIKKKLCFPICQKKNKLVLLLSTLHEGAEISEQTGKPAIINNYNETKSGVDAFDKLCSGTTCSRKTKRWPLCIFYGMINTAFINSYVIYCNNMLKKGRKPLRRSQFMIKLSSELSKPWMEHRLTLPNLRRYLRHDIEEILQIDEQEQRKMPPDNKRTVCFYCPSKLRRMTTSHCTECKRAYCNEHRGHLCSECT